MCRAISSPESTSPALINFAGFGAGSSSCASAAGAANAAMNITKANRTANRRLVMSIISVSELEQCPLPHGRGQRAFIEIVELAANWHAMREPGHLDARFLQQVGDIVCRGLAVDSGVQGQNDFRHALIMRARHQRID